MERNHLYRVALAGALQSRRAGPGADGEVAINRLTRRYNDVQAIAKEQNFAGKTKAIYVSPVTGTFDWRGYLREEMQESLHRMRKGRKAPVARSFKTE